MKRVLLTVLAAIALCVLPTHGQTPSPPSEQEVEELLELQDRLLLERMQRQYLSDPRYDALLDRIATRTTPHLAEVFPGQPPQVRCLVFLSNMGFNAASWHRLVLVDSLLLDGLKRLSQGIAVYQSLDNPYTTEVLGYVHRLSVNGGYGAPLLSGGMDRENPYHIPPPPGMNRQTSLRADQIFEELLAAWLCHEVSHCYLGHARARLLAAWELERSEPGPGVNGLLRTQRIEQVLDYQMGPGRELEADRAGARLALRSGYSLEGFSYCLEVIARLEHLSGVDAEFYRSHPRPEERWAAVVGVARELGVNSVPGPTVLAPPGSLTR